MTSSRQKRPVSGACFCVARPLPCAPLAAAPGRRQVGRYSRITSAALRGDGPPAAAGVARPGAPAGAAAAAASVRSTPWKTEIPRSRLSKDSNSRTRFQGFDFQGLNLKDSSSRIRFSRIQSQGFVCRSATLPAGADLPRADRAGPGRPAPARRAEQRRRARRWAPGREGAAPLRGAGSETEDDPDLDRASRRQRVVVEVDDSPPARRAAGPQHDVPR
jgi:hypothetical protein